jgi:tetratricopeptide (TPR) repeat protein
VKHWDDESGSEEEFVQKVLPAFTRSQVSPGFRERVLARIEEASASRHRDFRWGIPTWVQLWTPALTVGLALIAFMTWLPLPLSRHPAERSPEQGTSGIRGTAPAQETEESLHRLVQKGLQEVRAEDTRQAKLNFLEALEQVAAPLNELAWMAYEQGNAADGLPRAQLAVQLLPENADYQDTLAMILCALDRREEAVEALEHAARLQPKKYGDKLARFREGTCQ